MSAADRSPGRSDQSRPDASQVETPAAIEATLAVPGAGTAAAAATGREIAGVVGEARGTRSGEDTRRRGWFWHWNSIVTQFAPLLGLKGVGLLNSYTVWTDRREESPHRGYAFPSQQSEADFYGEDRAELIAINKILVALDLIEIRKEMVLRTDERGRRWRVPHNFYRVKDHADGFALTGDKVLKVVELADRDAAVYRHVRHVFSNRFAPIDGDNPWHRILPELRRTDVWQRLASRVAAEEARAAARTRAGHASRSKRGGKPVGAAADPGFFVPDPGATATTAGDHNDSTDVKTNRESETFVATTNDGLGVDVAGTNNALEPASMVDVALSNDGSPTVVPGVNSGRATGVEPTNRTYDQEILTTTTRQPAQADDRITRVAGRHDTVTGMQAPDEAGRDDDLRSLPHSHTPTASGAEQADAVDDAGTAGPGGRLAPEDGPGMLAAMRAFEEANARRATPAERRLLRELAERFDPAAIERGRSGWEWVAAAIYEAVEAGSAFVAPRRIREIMGRWERDGAGRRGDGETGRREDGGSGSGGMVRVEEVLGEGPDLPLPHGHGSRRTWAFVVGMLAGAVAPERLVELVAGTAIVGYRDGEVTVAAPDPVQAERLATTYRDLVARKLSEAMRRPVRLAVLTMEAEGRRGGEAVGATEGAPLIESEEPSEEPARPIFLVPECDLPSRQVWAAVLEEVLARGVVGRANFDAWLRPTELIGRGEDGAFVVGAPHALAQRRIAARFLPPLRAAVAAVVGARLPVEVVVAADWLRANPPVINGRPEGVVRGSRGA